MEELITNSNVADLVALDPGLITELGVSNYMVVVITLSLIAILFYILRTHHNTLKELLIVNKELITEIKSFQEIEKERIAGIVNSINRVERNFEN